MDEGAGGKEECAKKRVTGQKKAPVWNDYVRFAERMAYGVLHLLPEQFEKLTIGELEQLIDGWEERRKLRLREQFTMVANLMNIHLKQGSQVSVKRLLEQVLPPDEDVVAFKKKRAEFENELTPEQRERVKKYVSDNS
jgi:hypothetical protein